MKNLGGPSQGGKVNPKLPLNKYWPINPVKRGLHPGVGGGGLGGMMGLPGPFLWSWYERETYIY